MSWTLTHSHRTDDESYLATFISVVFVQSALNNKKAEVERSKGVKAANIEPIKQTAKKKTGRHQV